MKGIISTSGRIFVHQNIFTAAKHQSYDKTYIFSRIRSLRKADVTSNAFL